MAFSYISEGNELKKLQTAKEILAEVFRVRTSDVDEMIQNRCCRRGFFLEE